MYASSTKDIVLPSTFSADDGVGGERAILKHIMIAGELGHYVRSDQARAA